MGCAVAGKVAGKENAAKGATAAKRKLAEDTLQSRANGDVDAAAQPSGKKEVAKRAKHTNGAANGAANGHAAELAADIPTNRSGRQVCNFAITPAGSLGR